MLIIISDPKQLLGFDFLDTETTMPPPNFDWFDLIEYYAFRLVLLISFLYTLYEVLKHTLKGVSEVVPKTFYGRRRRFLRCRRYIELIRPSKRRER